MRRQSKSLFRPINDHDNFSFILNFPMSRRWSVSYGERLEDDCESYFDVKNTRETYDLFHVKLTHPFVLSQICMQICVFKPV